MFYYHWKLGGQIARNFNVGAIAQYGQYAVLWKRVTQLMIFKLFSIARNLEAGKGYVITKNDRPIGKFIPFDQDELEEKKRRAFLAGERIKQLRKGVTLGPDLTIKDLVNEGRKYI